jgi:hypothetical protein
VCRRLTHVGRALTLVVAGCADTDAVPADPPMEAGVWRGDVAPSGGSPFGALFHVVGSDGGVTIRLESQFIQQSFTRVVAEHDTLRFSWPMTTPRECLLLRRQDDGWQGACHGADVDPIGLLLVPPGRYDVPTGLARAAYESDIPWLEERAGPLRVLVQAGGAAAGHVTRLRDGAVMAFDSAFALLEETPPDVPFWIVYVDSRVELRQLVGWPAGGWADGVARAVVNTVTADGRAPDRHEFMHVAATVAWGVPPTPWAWIHEGLATYAAGECAGAGIHHLAAALAQSGSAAPLHRLIHQFRELDEVGAYLQSASVIGYVRETFGIAAVRSVWQEGPDALPVVTAMDLAALERDWRDFVSGFPAASDALASVHARGCL